MIKTTDGSYAVKAELCNYCGKIVKLSDIKAIKNINNIVVKKAKICRKCWGNSELRKLFKNNKVVYLSIKIF